MTAYQPAIGERLLDVDLQISVSSKLWADSPGTNEEFEEAMAAEAQKFALRYLTSEPGDPNFPYVVSNALSVSVIVRDAT